jgi:hypothetical protein
MSDGNVITETPELDAKQQFVQDLLEGKLPEVQDQVANEAPPPRHPPEQLEKTEDKPVNPNHWLVRPRNPIGDESSLPNELNEGNETENQNMTMWRRLAGEVASDAILHIPERFNSKLDLKKFLISRASDHLQKTSETIINQGEVSIDELAANLYLEVANKSDEGLEIYVKSVSQVLHQAQDLLDQQTAGKAQTPADLEHIKQLEEVTNKWDNFDINGQINVTKPEENIDSDQIMNEQNLDAKAQESKLKDTLGRMNPSDLLELTDGSDIDKVIDEVDVENLNKDKLSKKDILLIIILLFLAGSSMISVETMAAIFGSGGRG